MRAQHHYCCKWATRIWRRCFSHGPTRVLAPSCALGTNSTLRPSAVAALSPCRGLALASWPGIICNLVQFSQFSRQKECARSEFGACNCPTAMLLQELFYKVSPEAPLRCTRNRSLPASHLTAARLGHVYLLGLLLDQSHIRNPNIKQEDLTQKEESL